MPGLDWLVNNPNVADGYSTHIEGDWEYTSGGFSGRTTRRRNIRTGEVQYPGPNGTWSSQNPLVVAGDDWASQIEAQLRSGGSPNRGSYPGQGPFGPGESLPSNPFGNGSEGMSYPQVVQPYTKTDGTIGYFTYMGSYPPDYAGPWRGSIPEPPVYTNPGEFAPPGRAIWEPTPTPPPQPRPPTTYAPWKKEGRENLLGLRLAQQQQPKTGFSGLMDRVKGLAQQQQPGPWWSNAVGAVRNIPPGLSQRKKALPMQNPWASYLQGIAGQSGNRSGLFPYGRPENPYDQENQGFSPFGGGPGVGGGMQIGGPQGGSQSDFFTRQSRQFSQAADPKEQAAVSQALGGYRRNRGKSPLRTGGF